MPRSLSKAISYVNSQVVEAKARYLASTYDLETVAYLFDLQKMIESPKKHKNQL